MILRDDPKDNPGKIDKPQVVRLTPPGRGAVASILLTGLGTDALLAGRVRVGTDANRPMLGRFRLKTPQTDDPGLFEEVVVLRAGPDEIEIHSHGGEAVVAALESALVEDGAIRADWTELFCPGDSQRERALRMIPNAETERVAQILIDQYHGALERELAAVDLLDDPKAQRRRRDRLRENARLGRHLIEPFRVVLAGATNAGKSSLFNAILGFRRTIVDAEPGTTRDVVSGRTALNGFPVEFFDTAGFRGTEHELEREGIRRSERSLAEADLVVWVVDSTVPRDRRPPVPDCRAVLRCFNKTDLAAPETGERESGVYVSAATGSGLERLLDAIVRRLIPEPPKPSEAVPLPPADAQQSSVAK